MQLKKHARKNSEENVSKMGNNKNAPKTTRNTRCWFTPAKKNNNKYKSNNKNTHEKFFEFDASTKKKQHENQSAIAKNKFWEEN